MNKKGFTLVEILAVIIILGIVLVIVISTKNAVEDKKYDDMQKREFSEIEYIIPSEFESDDNFIMSNYYEDDVYCGAYFYASSKYDTNLEEWFKQRVTVSLDDEVGEVKELTIGGKKAYSIEVKTKYKVEHYYGLESSNYYYMFNYYIDDDLKQDRNDIDTNICYISENKILDSIVLK